MNKCSFPRFRPKFAFFLSLVSKYDSFRLETLSLLPKLSLLLCLCLSAVTAPAATYYVTQNGGGNHDGASLASSWSVGDFNGTGVPGGGDTVVFTGSFTSTIAPASNGASNAARLTLDLTGASLNSAWTRLQFNARAYLTVLGGALGGAYDGLLINFNPNDGGTSHDITISGFQYTGSANGIALFLSLNHVYNLVVANCYADNVSSFVSGDSTLNHDIDISGNFAQTSTDVLAQDDLIHIGDAPNVTIEGNKLVGRAPANPSGRHNDIIQNYTKAGAFPGNPTNWVIRYNWIESQQVSGSGDCAWIMFQSMSGDPALKLYGNVFVGTGTVGDNGILVSRNNGGTYFLYNNTFVKHAKPENTVRFLDSGTLYARNNVGQADTPGGSVFAGWAMGDGGWDYNFFYRTASPSEVTGPHGSLSTDPGFTNYAGADFSFSPASPLWNKGDPSIGAEYAMAIAPGATWPNPALVSRSTVWNPGAY